MIYENPNKNKKILVLNFSKPPPRPISALDDLLLLHEEWKPLLDDVKQLSSHKSYSKYPRSPSPSSSIVSSLPGKTTLSKSGISRSVLSRPIINPSTLSKLINPNLKSSTSIEEPLTPRTGLLSNTLPWQKSNWMHFYPLRENLVCSNSSWNYSGHTLISILQSSTKTTLLLADKTKNLRTPKATLNIIAKNVLIKELPVEFKSEALSNFISLSTKKKSLSNNDTELKSGIPTVLNDLSTNKSYNSQLQLPTSKPFDTLIISQSKQDYRIENEMNFSSKRKIDKRKK